MARTKAGVDSDPRIRYLLEVFNLADRFDISVPFREISGECPSRVIHIVVPARVVKCELDFAI